MHPIKAAIIGVLLGVVVGLLCLDMQYSNFEDRECVPHGPMQMCYDTTYSGLWPLDNKVCHLYFYPKGQPRVGGKIPCKPAEQTTTEGGVV